MPKGRESGMPDAAMWGTFFDVEAALDQLDCRDVADVVEFGCGYGHFTVSAARRSSGRVFAFDIEAEMVEFTRQVLVEVGLSHVVVAQRDFMTDGTGLRAAEADYVLAFNILHIEQPHLLLQEVARVLKPSGRLAVIHWKFDKQTPRGPSLAIRPTMEQCRAWAEAAGFEFVHGGDLAGCPWHWGMVLKRSEKEFRHALLR